MIEGHAHEGGKTEVRHFDFGDVRFVSETTLTGYIHACTPADLERVLTALPSDDARGLAFVVFHQPTRKEERAHPRWAAYVPEYVRGPETGPAILLEAINPSKPLRWSSSLDPEDARELSTLKQEGHTVIREGGSILISLDIETVRQTQRRSLLHELGHHVDDMRAPRSFAKKTTAEKESFADRYARDAAPLVL